MDEFFKQFWPNLAADLITAILFGGVAYSLVMKQKQNINQNNSGSQTAPIIQHADTVNITGTQKTDPEITQEQIKKN